MIANSATGRTTLFIATPSAAGLVTQEYLLSMMALGSCASIGLEIIVGLLGHDTVISRSRNLLVAHFLDSDATHLLFVDPDIGFESRQIQRMLAFDEDVVCGVYPSKTRDWSKTTLDLMGLGIAPETASLKYVGVACDADEFEIRGDFVTAQYAGCGFMLIKRQAIERMTTVYPETAYRLVDGHLNNGPRRAYALFEQGIDHDSGEYLSEDMVFCRRFRAMGGKIWLDLRGRLTLVGPHSFAGDPAISFQLPGSQVRRARSA